jgi:hypothetical protein
VSKYEPKHLKVNTLLHITCEDELNEELHLIGLNSRIWIKFKWASIDYIANILNLAHDHEQNLYHIFT